MPASVHTDSAERAIKRIMLLVLQAGTQLGREGVRHYARSTVNIFGQFARTGRRRPVEIMLA